MGESSLYNLNHGEASVEEQRLTFQHAGFLKLTKTLIPPNIKSYLLSLDRPLAIADVGTGTGIWLRELAAEFPENSRFDGFDVDESKFLPPQRRPSNVTLSHGDVLKPFPEDLLGTYDLVHVRLLMFALKADEWALAAANLRTLLRPGGYLIWDETGYPSWVILPPTDTTHKWLSLDIRYSQSVGRDITSPTQLQRHFENAGYVECTHEDFGLPYSNPTAEMKKFANSAAVNMGRQSLHGIVDRGGFGWLQSHQQVEELFDKMQKDFDEGVCTLSCIFTWTIGRQPLN